MKGSSVNFKTKLFSNYKKVKSLFTKESGYFWPSVYFGWTLFVLLVYHFSLIAISQRATFWGLKGELLSTMNVYILISIFMTFLLFAVSAYLRNHKWLRRIFLIKFNVISWLYIYVRAVDWGAVYFGGNHVDSEFWFHAFYVDGLSFLVSPVSYVLAGSLLLYMLMNIFFTRKLKSSPLLKSGQNGSFILSWFKPAGVIVLITGLLLNTLFVIPADAGKDPSLSYTVNPELCVFSSFIDYVSGPADNKIFILREDTIAKLKKCGIEINTLDKRYPLIKKSIFVDKKRRGSEKPTISKDTNVIIIFAESLSGFFIKEEIHKIPGLTPNIHDMRKKSYSFERMLNASFPTFKGMISTLGSGLYGFTKMPGMNADDETKQKRGIWAPILARNMLLSDVLKRRGYATVHVQGSTSTFVGMGNSFTKRQNYDKFYSRESLDLIQFSKTGLNRGSWGIRDEDVLGYAVKMLKEKKPSKPFLMTISTIDMHPPFDPLRKIPIAEGNVLLNSLYSFDYAFGIFWNYFINSEYKENTIVILVADHAMGPITDYTNLLDKYGMASQTRFDYIASLMYLPGNEKWAGKKNMMICSNLDIAPTIMDMMNIDQPNPFLGLSIFSERPYYPLIISSFDMQNRPYIMADVSPADKEIIKSIGWSAKDQADFDLFIVSLTKRRAIYPDEDYKN